MPKFLLLAMLVMEPFITAKGRVLDANGAVIKEAEIIYRRDLSGAEWAMSMEDRGQSNGDIHSGPDGQYTAEVHPGLYDVCVMASFLTPECRKVDVTVENPIFPVFRLKVDPEAIKKVHDAYGNISR